jgi:MFS family permease
MYLAAMPIIARQWGVPDSRVALSLVLWFAGFSVFLLVYGPLSDKYGRRPVLLGGLAQSCSARPLRCEFRFCRPVKIFSEFPHFPLAPGFFLA